MPHRAGGEPLRPREVAASVPMDRQRPPLDGSFREAVTLPRDPDAWSQTWIEQRFDDPVTVRSVVVGLPGPRGFGAAPAAEAVLQVSDDGTEYRDVVRLYATAVPARTAAFAAGDRSALPAGALRRQRRGCTAAHRLRRSAPSGSAARARVPRLRVRAAHRCARAPRGGEGRLRRRARLLRDRRRAGCRRAGVRRRDRSDRTRRGRSTAMGGTARSLADPAARRVAHRTDQRPGAARLDRSRGRQARRRSRGCLPRDPPLPASAGRMPHPRASPRCSATASKRVRRTGPTTSASSSHVAEATTPSPGLRR